MDTGIKFCEIWIKSTVNKSVSHANFLILFTIFFFIFSELDQKFQALIFKRKKTTKIINFLDFQQKYQMPKYIELYIKVFEGKEIRNLASIPFILSQTSGIKMSQNFQLGKNSCFLFFFSLVYMFSKIYVFSDTYYLHIYRHTKAFLLHLIKA